MLKNLDDHVLLDAYDQAVKQNLDLDFLSILQKEIDERGLSEEFQRPNLSLIMD